MRQRQKQIRIVNRHQGPGHDGGAVGEHDRLDGARGIDRGDRIVDSGLKAVAVLPAQDRNEPGPQHPGCRRQGVSHPGQQPALSFEYARIDLPHAGEHARRHTQLGRQWRRGQLGAQHVRHIDGVVATGGEGFGDHLCLGVAERGQSRARHRRVNDPGCIGRRLGMTHPGHSDGVCGPGRQYGDEEERGSHHHRTRSAENSASHRSRIPAGQG